MFSSTSSLHLGWSSNVREIIDISTIDEQLLRIIADYFVVERDTIQFTRHESSHEDSEILFTFPGGFLYANSSHLTVRVTVHTTPTSTIESAICSPITSVFLNQIVKLFCRMKDEQKYSLNDLVSSLVYVTFGTPGNEMYEYLSSACTDGEWFANSVSPQSVTPNRPLTVSGFVSGGASNVSSPTPSHCLSLSEGLLFFPTTTIPTDCTSCPVTLSPISGALRAIVTPSLPFDSEPGQLICQPSKNGHQISFVEGSCSFGTFGDRVMSLSVASSAEATIASIQRTFFQHRELDAKIPECVIVEIIAGGVEEKHVSERLGDPVVIKNVTLEGCGYRINLKHMKQQEAMSEAVPTTLVPVVTQATETSQNSPLKRSGASGVRLASTLPRSASKQALSSLLNQLQNKRPRNTTPGTTVVPEIQVIHIAKSAEGDVVPGLPSVYQEEADVLRRYINHFHPDRAVMLVNTQKVVEQWNRWKLNLPRVQPYYAVKCNGDLGILETLATLGSNFDCASQGEMDVILKTLQLSSDRIIYSNPCKQEYGVRHAKQRKVKLSVFDNIDELIKMARLYPECDLLLRIVTDDSGSQCPLSCKFGASSSSWNGLLDKAKALKLNVRGVHFHVGSGCSQRGMFTKALYDARRVFDLGAERGFKMDILNIGGGFPGVVRDRLTPPPPPYSESHVTFEDLCTEIGPTLDSLFPLNQEYKIMAEPGRYFAAPSSCLAVKIHSRRQPIKNDLKGEAPGNFLYYINDGVYGSFNNLIFDHADVVPRVLLHPAKQASHGEHELADGLYGCTIESAIFGQTCDGFDCVKRRIELPQLEVGDWLMFEEMGAYTVCAASTFNGFELPTRVHVRILPSAASTRPEVHCSQVNVEAKVADCISLVQGAPPTPHVAGMSILQQEQRPATLLLLPCLAGYEEYQQHRQQLVQHNSNNILPYSRSRLISQQQEELESSLNQKTVSMSQSLSKLVIVDHRSNNHTTLQSKNTNSFDGFNFGERSTQRPRVSFRPLSVRPLQSTAQQHTSYPRLGGGKFNPRLVATLLRSAYCRHRPITPTASSSSSSNSLLSGSIVGTRPTHPTLASMDSTLGGEPVVETSSPGNQHQSLPLTSVSAAC